MGGGNHFIEANRDDEGNIYVVVHSGSRHLGLEVAGYYQEQGYRTLNGSTQIPKQLAYVSGELFVQYIHDMRIVQRYAELNRQAMMDEIVKGMKFHVWSNLQQFIIILIQMP